MAKFIEIQGVNINLDCIGKFYAGQPVIRNQSLTKKTKSGGQEFDEIECPTLVIEGCNGASSQTFVYDSFSGDEKKRDADIKKLKEALEA